MILENDPRVLLHERFHTDKDFLNNFMEYLSGQFNCGVEEQNVCSDGKRIKINTDNSIDNCKDIINLFLISNNYLNIRDLSENNGSDYYNITKLSKNEIIIIL